MKTMFCTLAVISALSATSRARAAETRSLDQFDFKGEKRTCIQSYDIDETKVIDDNDVLFRVHVDEYYVNRLRRPCPDLRVQRRFKYTLRGTSELCSGDAITVIDGVGMGPGCILGQFEAVEKKK
jgi:hypothetical protein